VKGVLRALAISPVAASCGEERKLTAPPRRALAQLPLLPRQPSSLASRQVVTLAAPRRRRPALATMLFDGWL
jgi:hypothetical protein